MGDQGSEVRVQRDFKAGRPNELRVADPTYVATWARFAYVAVVIERVLAGDRRLAGADLAAERHRPRRDRAGDPRSAS